MSHPPTRAEARRLLTAKRLLRQDLTRYGLALFGISGLINILALTGAIYMMQVYDRALTSGSLNTLLALSILALGLYLFQGGFDAIRAQIMVRIGARLDKRLAPLAHRVAVDMPRFGFSTTEALERGRNVDTLRGFLTSGAPPALFDLPWMPVFLLFVYALHPLLGAITLCGAVVLSILTVVAEIRSRDLTQSSQQAMVQRNITAESNARAADALVSMGLVDRAVRRFETANAEALALQTRGADVNATISSISRVLRMILQSALLGVGAFLTIGGHMSAGAIMAVSVAAGRALAPIDQVIGNWRGILGARNAWVQLRETLGAMPEERSYLTLPKPQASLKVEGLTVASPANGRVLLSDISFELSAGQALAVIGPSGGGKSTLLRALAGVWPALRGTVRFDGTALNHWEPARMGELVGYLPQEVNLFNASILDNIARLSEQRDSAAIHAASAAAGVHGMISSMPEGYDTQVGSHGSALSAGQRQRIGLARALYGQPFVVMLDEPNSALDAMGEKALNETIRDIRARGGIVIVVAHRPNVLSAVDMLAIVQGGRMIAFGPRDEVLGEKAGRVVVPMEAASGLAAGVA
ncbi:ATP-binding cassette subfamily C protein [Cereibacter changlensis]|uniref:ATP-binding cassette subfamily C protein n=2 Tax=Cereibacter changlensis TaxID=402884 RepID=A0A2W7R7N1_9RHOB|nr:type I secretion system permease/ATPase [Cereibacter changlensis]PZX56434.1 ATP-binding cassette subfamily C protein [Cereibacter changlensis]